jgi:hypothetical protein
VNRLFIFNYNNSGILWQIFLPESFTWFSLYVTNFVGMIREAAIGGAGVGTLCSSIRVRLSLVR